MLTIDQRYAIEGQLAMYPDGCLRHHVHPGERYEMPDGVAVEFEYVRADQPDLLGLEVTVFAADGTVLASQDYG